IWTLATAKLGPLPPSRISHSSCSRMAKLRCPGGSPNDPWQKAGRSMQVQLAGLSPQGRLVVAEQSDHSISTEEPDLVVRAVADMSRDPHQARKPLPVRYSRCRTTLRRHERPLDHKVAPDGQLDPPPGPNARTTLPGTPPPAPRTAAHSGRPPPP